MDSCPALRRGAVLTETTKRDKVVPFPQDSDYPAHVPPGVYRLSYHHRRFVQRFDRTILEVYFKVQDFGEHFGKIIVRYYNVRLSEKGKSFTASPQSDFVRDYCVVFGRRPKFRLAPLNDFKRVIVEGEVGSVKKDYLRRKHLELMQYSTVKKLLRLEQG